MGELLSACLPCRFTSGVKLFGRELVHEERRTDCLQECSTVEWDVVATLLPGVGTIYMMSVSLACACFMCVPSVFVSFTPAYARMITNMYEFLRVDGASTFRGVDYSLRSRKRGPYLVYYVCLLTIFPCEIMLLPCSTYMFRISNTSYVSHS